VFCLISQTSEKIVDCAVCTVCTDADVACLYADVAGPYRQHVVAPRDDMC
jgi:hypothetical protein